MSKLFDKFKLFEEDESTSQDSYETKPQSATLDSILHNANVPNTSNSNLSAGQSPIDSNLKNLLGIDTIYQNNNLKDVSNNIFKVEEIKNVLPKDLPADVLKKSVIAMMPISNFCLEEALNDATNRITILQSTMQQFTSQTINLVQANDLKVKELEEQINKLKEETLTRKRLEEEQSKLISDEVTKITNIVNFIDPDSIQTRTITKANS